MTSPSADLEKSLDILAEKKRPYIILFLGVNGGGKTTTIAKLASYIKKGGFRAVMSASDTFRAGAIEQLSAWSIRTGIEIIKHEQGSDPSAVAFDAINHAIARKNRFCFDRHRRKDAEQQKSH